MNGKYNLKSIIVGFIIILAGIGAILLDYFILKTAQNIWISIGCSLLASGIVILATALLVDVKEVDALKKWGLVKIYKTRSEKGKDSDPELDKAKKQLDVVAFGLKSFRTMHDKKIEKLLRRGIDVRILTMNPDVNNIFLTQREKEENEPPGQILNSIIGLVEWADKLNKLKFTGKIIVKGYECMTLDFYWRVDNEVYIGPYCYGIGSQQTITYKFKEGKIGFDLYTDYFERLWNDKEITKVLTA